jgi:hypothetical protein
VVKKQSVFGERIFGDDPSRLYGLCDLQAFLIPNFSYHPVWAKNPKVFFTGFQQNFFV